MSRPILELAEWQSKVMPEASLTASDRLFAERFAIEGGARLIVDELRRGVRVTAKSWVGVVRFEGFEVRVVPKLIGGNLRLVELIQIAAGLGALRRGGGVRSLSTGEGSLFDLVALLFAQSCEALIARGVITDYVEREEDLPVLRGRFLPARQMLERFGQIDRLICRFDDREHDIWENQLLALAIVVASRRVSEPAVASRLRRLRAVFDPICDPSGVELRTLDSDGHYNRLNEHYREAHGLARVILKAGAVDDIFRSGKTTSFSFLLDMNRLFEQFVFRVLDANLDPGRFRLRYQHVDKSIIRRADTGNPYARVIPDFLIEQRGASGAGRRIAVDAKYKLYDDKKVASADIYQSFLYAQAYGVRGTGIAEAMLVYPSVLDGVTVLPLEIRGVEGRGRASVKAIGLPVEQTLDELTSGAHGSVLEALFEAVLPTPSTGPTQVQLGSVQSAG
jgi:5-methylcytosine-specific restriction enzyme subunit McrC